MAYVRAQLLETRTLLYMSFWQSNGFDAVTWGNTNMYFDSRLWGFTAGVRHRIFAAVLLGIIAVTLGMARLALLGWLIAQVFLDIPIIDLIPLIVLVVIVMIARGWLEYLRTMIAHNTAALVQKKIRSVIFDKIFDLGPSTLNLKRTGEITIAMVEGVEQLEIYFGQYLPQLLISIMTPPLIFFTVAFFDLSIALVMLVAAIFTLIAPQVFHQWDKKSSLRRGRSYKKFASDLLDSIQGLVTLKTFGQSEARAEDLRVRAEHLFKSTMWVLATNSLARGITDIGITLGTAATLTYGAFRVANGDMSLGILLMVLMLGVEVYRPLRDMRALMHNGMMSQASAQTIFEIIDQKPIIRQKEPSHKKLNLDPDLSFNEIKFGYPDSDQITHDNLSFKVKKGERVGFVGSSGCGKSSVVKLLLRFYDPSSGIIKIGGYDLRDLSLQEIRSKIAVVHQDTYLFHGTVAENLRLGKCDATDQEIKEACKASNSSQFIEELPQGYETIIGERGVRLSGGQRQRIAIARAILRNAPILVLDEALSSVDAENEAIIQQALDRLMHERTTLIFAHRLSSVINCDRILVIDGGSITEEGSHAELMKNKGKYFQLMEEQTATGFKSEEDYKNLFIKNEHIDSSSNLQNLNANKNFEESVIGADGLSWADALRELAKYIYPYKVKLTMAFAFGVTRVFAFIGIGILGALAVGAVKNNETFLTTIYCLVALAPIAGIFHWLESWISHDMAFRLLSEMRIALFRKLDTLAPAYMVRRRTGDMVGMATYDIELVEYFFAHTVAPAFVAIIVPSLVLVSLFLYGWQMALALIPFLLIVAGSPFFLRKRVDEMGSKAREALGEMNAFAVDSIQGLSEIIAFNCIQEKKNKLIETTDYHHRVRLPFFRDLTLQNTIFELCTGLGGLAVVITGAISVGHGNLDSAILPLLVILSMSAFLPISEISNVSRQLADTLGSTRRIHKVSEEKPMVFDGPGAAIKSKHEGMKVSFLDVDFSYECSSSKTLNRVNINAEAGNTIAIVGPSGAGKTTIAHLMMRYWDPKGGCILLDGIDIREFKLSELRSKIALVAQDTYLFNNTLRENILIANPNASKDQLHTAIEKASLSSFISNLPNGLNTNVGEFGMRLSGGQRQRVSIARAFLKDSPILILDEATSHLDAINENIVRKSLHGLMKSRTTLVIAHRLSTIKNSDLIIVLDHGSVIEAGRHEELLKNDKLYARLVFHQSAVNYRI